MAELDDLRAACARQLDWQQARTLGYMAYYDGQSQITALMDSAERETFMRFLQESYANRCELIVNAVAERLQVVGFRFGTSTDAAWAIWQANQLDADSELVQTDALVCGRSYVLVQADDDNPSGVCITAESPLECTVLYEPGNRRKRLAGYKRFADPLSQQVTEVLVTPDTIATWYPATSAPELEANPAGVVSLIEMQPQPRTSMARPPRSELDPAIPFQDRIHTTIFNRLVASDYGAFRQIWATGVKLSRTLVTAEDGSTTEALVQPYNVGANRLLTNENPDGKFGSFPESTLAGYLGAVEADVTHLAAITQTPPHYLLGKIANLSADAIKAAEAGLVSKVARRALHIGETWEAVMRLALGLVGDPGTTYVGAEVIWRDFETRSEAQLVDALIKMATLGVPREVLWQRWGATPQEVQSWQGMAAAQAAQDAANQAAALGAADIAKALSSGGGAAPEADLSGQSL